MKNAQKIRENVGVNKKSAYVIYEWPPKERDNQAAANMIKVSYSRKCIAFAGKRYELITPNSWLCKYCTITRNLRKLNQ